MAFRAAAELEKRATDRREAERDRALTRTSLERSKYMLIVAAALLVGAVITLLLKFGPDSWKFWRPPTPAETTTPPAQASPK